MAFDNKNSQKRFYCVKSVLISLSILIDNKCVSINETTTYNNFSRYEIIICPMRQQHWTDYKISLCVCE